ncbi:MAG TPA: ECF-type sigma factor [Wenzhouxiangellaceae bacterium]|nr:ECF-type sigma factor [Wenzhouxiangellaceae bacterium]
MAESAHITRLLKRWSSGETEAREALLPLVYQRLRRLAENQLHGERPGHTLQPTALVNEAFMRLDQGNIDWDGRRHFYALAARTMRRVLVDHARGRQRVRRGGDFIRVTLSAAERAQTSEAFGVLDLDKALGELERNHQRVGEAIELTYFGGLEAREVAAHLGVSSRTVERDLRFGRAWLKDKLVVP